MQRMPNKSLRCASNWGILHLRKRCSNAWIGFSRVKATLFTLQNYQTVV